VNRCLLVVVVLLSAAFVSSGSIRAARPEGQRSSREDHIDWVAGALKRMQTVNVGMTRDDLLKVFGMEGGLSTRSHRTFVSRDCPYFKVDVEFRTVGRAGDEGRQDVIVKISRPYLQFSILN
jgi:hypothetical protein